MKKLASLIVLSLLSLSVFADWNQSRSCANKPCLKAVVDTNVSASVFPASVGDSIKKQIDIAPGASGSFCLYTTSKGADTVIHIDIACNAASPVTQSSWSASESDTSLSGLQAKIAAKVTAGTFPQAEADALNAALSAVPQSGTSYSYSSTCNWTPTSKITSTVFGQ